MSLFSALTTAVGGLAAQSSAIANVSDNLANTNTNGFKGIDTQFSSLVTQSNAFLNDPGGVRATPHYTNGIQGSLIQSQSATALAISGQGFFPVRAGIANADGTTAIGTTPYFTRAGDFSLDKNGYMVNASGYYLTGYNVDSDGVVDTSHTDAIMLSELLDNPVATTSVNYAGNLPAGADLAFASSPSTIQIYDTLGGQHNLTFTWSKTGVNEWSLSVDVPDSSYSATVPFSFNTDGTIDTLTTGANYTVIDNSASAVNLAQIRFNTSFAGTGAQTVTMTFGTYDSAQGVTQYADTAGSVSVSSFDQNGIPRGSFQSLAIDKNGFVSLNYDNGQNRIIAQIPIVQFFAQDQLQRASGGVYLATLNSGTARYSAPGTNGAGIVVGNSLEGSNVDIATEFTKLIQAQRVYSANARTITTSDNMLQEVINIIR
ncbi:MAG: flagellar hook protein FlgE [Alphaproteobacteria bacterium]|nr:flagellar hook protein FlgE [Alphaproteobacteria bacterium]